MQHIPDATDMESKFVRRLQKDLCTSKFRKPWDLQKDGGVARLLLQFIMSKGPRTVNFTKVEGHVEQAHVEAGIVTQD